MEHVLNTIIFTTVLISISIALLGIAYIQAIHIQEAPISTIQLKILEIKKAIELLNMKTNIYGVYTGKFSLESIEIEPFSILLKIPGGEQFIFVKRLALKINDLKFSNELKSNFTYNNPSLKISNSYIIPIASITFTKTDMEFGSKINYINIKVPLLLNFKASGNFDLSISLINKTHEVYDFEIIEKSTIELYIDGERALIFSCEIGEKLKIVIEYLFIKIERI
ncbi:MAG: hypothetical protein QXI49_02635 [Candidatus Methanomethylicaceae archaeon]